MAALAYGSTPAATMLLMKSPLNVAVATEPPVITSSAVL